MLWAGSALVHEQAGVQRSFGMQELHLVALVAVGAFAGSVVGQAVDVCTAAGLAVVGTAPAAVAGIVVAADTAAGPVVVAVAGSTQTGLLVVVHEAARRPVVIVVEAVGSGEERPSKQLAIAALEPVARLMDHLVAEQMVPTESQW